MSKIEIGKRYTKSDDQVHFREYDLLWNGNIDAFTGSRPINSIETISVKVGF